MNINFYKDVSYEYIAKNVLSKELQLMLASATTPANLSIREEKSIQNVPREVFSEVFCKLSLTELSQVRCVCKQWRTIENGRLLTLIALVALVGKEKLCSEFEWEIDFLLKNAFPQPLEAALPFLMTPENRPFTTLLFKMGSMLTLKNPEEPFLKDFVKNVVTAASQGCAKSTFIEGGFYKEGLEVEKDIDTAFEKFKSAAEMDKNGSINFLVSKFYKPENIYNYPSDTTLYEKYLKTAADKGLRVAQFRIAESYLTQCEEKKIEAVKYLHKAWKQKYAPAYNLLFDCYLNGKGTTKDLEIAKTFLVEGAQIGSEACMYRLGSYYQAGSNGFEKNAKKAIEYFQQAADAGSYLAWEQMCTFYALGIGVPRDQSKAEKYFELFEDWVKNMADNGALYGEYLRPIAMCYEGGMGVERDLDMSMFLYDLSAEKGYTKSNYNLATYYEEGDFVPHDAEKMMDHYKLAADAGCTKAQYKMCQLYTQGFREILPDVNKARECFNTLMANNAPLGKPIALAYCYAFGFGTKVDHEKSIVYFHEAADKENYAAAQFRLCMHYAGIGENEKACTYFNLLSYELHRDESYRIKERYRNISFCYANGIGVQQNTQMATLYDQKAEATQSRFFPGSYL